MKILIGSYNKNIYEIDFDKNEELLTTKKILIEANKPSYLIKYDNLSYIYMKDDLQYIKIGEQDVLLNEGACHLSYDNKNGSIYTSFYGAGILKVLNKNENNNWEVTQTLKYQENSHIHYAEYIDTIDLVGVCDLGDNKFFLYENIDGKLNLKHTYTFTENFGPRHFVFKDNLIYIMNELKPSVTVLKFEDNKLKLVQNVELIAGAGSAIRMTKDQKYLYVAVREANLIYGFNIKENGLIDVMQKVHTRGNHPRDFNLIFNDEYLLVGNMHTNNLTLLKVINGKLYLIQENYKVDAPASINYK